MLYQLSYTRKKIQKSLSQVVFSPEEPSEGLRILEVGRSLLGGYPEKSGGRWI